MPPPAQPLPQPEAAAAALRVLVVDDSKVIRMIVLAEFLRQGWTVEEAADGEEALAAAAARRPDVVVCDLNMPGLDGTQVLARLCGLDPTLPVVMHSDEADLGRVLETVHEGAFDFIPKSTNLGPLVAAVGRAARHGQLVRDNQRLTGELRALNEALERRVEERTSELERVNRELDASLKKLTLAQKQMAHSEKFAALGQLAAGVAHEINTPVQFIGDSVRFLEEGFTALQELLGLYRKLLGSEAPAALAKAGEAEEEADLDYLLQHLPKALHRSQEGVVRVAGIVRALKEFAHPGRSSQAAADLNEAVQRTLTMAHNELKYVADVEVDLGALPPVECNVGELNQVFLNILVNAAHAVGDQVRPSGGRGRVTVRTRAVGEQVVISIADTGGGIPEAIRDRIYDPFFTTKEVGRGSGIGLSVARSIVVEKHGGELSFETREGEGTTFFIRLRRQRPE